MGALDLVRGAWGAIVRHDWRSDRAAKERRLRLDSPEGWSEVFGSDSWAGKNVTERTALQLATVFACVRVTADAVASLPLKVYERTPTGRVQRDDHELADLLGRDPNADQTALEFWECMVARAVLNGEGLAEKGYQGRFLNTLTPFVGAPVRRSDGELVYRRYERGKTEDLPRDKVFHLKGFGLGGDRGLSAIAYGVQTFGNAIAGEETVGKLFSNGMNVSGVLTSDQTLDEEQRPKLDKIMQTYAGSTKAGKLMILEAGLKYQQLSLNPEDAQMIEQRKFAIEEICRWFGVPPIVVGHAAQGQTMWGTGVEQILLSWLVTGINPLCTRIEMRILKQLISPAERRRIYAEFTREALLQMDSKAKAEFLSSMTQNGLMTRREGRAKLNLPPTGQDGEDKLTAQTNLAPLDKLGTVATGANAVRP